MQKIFKRIILPLAGISAITLPIISAVSLTEENQEWPIDLVPADDGFNGHYVVNSYIDLTRNEADNQDPFFGNIAPDMNKDHLEFTQKESAWDVRQYDEDNKSLGNYFSTTPLDDSVKKINNNNMANVVYLEEISAPDNNLFDSSTKRVRKWRATFNNYFIPKDPTSDVKPEQNQNSWTPDGYGNMNFGIVLTHDLQLVTNSVKVSVIAKDKNYNPISVEDKKGYFSYIVNGSNNNENATSVEIPNTFDPTNGITQELDVNDFIKNNQVLGDQNAYYYGNYINKQQLIQNNVFPKKWYDMLGSSSSSESTIANTPFLLNNLKYASSINATLLGDDYLSNLVNGDAENNDPTKMGSMYVSMLKQAPDSPLAKNMSNMGYALLGEVTTGNQWYRDSNYNPTVVVEFETVESQNPIYINNNDRKYVYAESDKPSGISAVLSWYRGYQVKHVTHNRNYVASHSLTYKRSDYRTLHLKITEQADYRNGNSDNDVFIPNGVGYTLKYNEQVIAKIPASLLNKARQDAFNKKLQKFTIDLKFNTDLSKWPKEALESYENFYQDGRLTLTQDFDDNIQYDRFFYVDDWSEYILMNPFLYDNQIPPLNKLPTHAYLLPTLDKDNTISFFSNFNWSNKLKIILLNQIKENKKPAMVVNILKNLLNNVDNADEIISKMSLTNNQINALIEGITADWNIDNFNDSENNFWYQQIAQLLYASYKVQTTLANDTKWAEFQKIQKLIVEDEDGELNPNELLTIQNWNSQDPEKRKLLENFMRFLLVPTDLRNKIPTAHTDLENWISKSVPSYKISKEFHGPIVDTNDAINKLNNLVTTYNDAFSNVENYTGNGFDDVTNATSDEVINKAFELIDSTTLYSDEYKTAFKNQVLRQTSREHIIQYVNALLALQGKESELKTTYNKYKEALPVADGGNAKYHSIQITEGKNSKTYVTFVNTMKKAKEDIEFLASYKNTVVNPEQITYKAITTNNKNLNPQLIPNSYSSIISDILNAIDIINTLTGLEKSQRDAYVQNIFNLVKNNTTIGDQNKQIEFYSQREAGIAKILAEAQFKNKVLTYASNSSNLFATLSNPLISFPEWKNSISSAKLIPMPVNTVPTDNPVKFMFSPDAHPALKSFKTINDIKVFVIPNIDAISASTNYGWQNDSQKYINDQDYKYPSNTYELLTITSSKYKTIDILFKDYGSLIKNSDLTADQLNNIYDSYAKLFDYYVTTYEKIRNKLKEDTNINSSDSDDKVITYNDLLFYAEMIYNKIFSLDNIQNGVITEKTKKGIQDFLDNDFNLLIKSYKKLNKTLAKVLIGNGDDENPETIFTNGQFYGNGNDDNNLTKWLADKNAYIYNMSDDQGKLIALLSTALRITSSAVDKSNINAIVSSMDNITPDSKIITASKYNLPSALLFTTINSDILSNSKENNVHEYNYSYGTIDKLNDAINNLVNNMHGRYDTLKDYPKFALTNFFSQINFDAKTNKPVALFDLAEANNLLNDVTLENFTFENNADAKYYDKINAFISDKAISYVKSLANLNDDEKNSIVKLLKYTQGTINFNAFNSLDATPNKLKWLKQVQLALYEANQIQNYKANILNNPSATYQYLNEYQLSLYNKIFTDANIFSSVKIDELLSKEDILPGFKDFTTILYNDASIQNKPNIFSQINDSMKTIHDFYDNYLASLNINQPNESVFVSLATNRKDFIKAYNNAIPYNVIESGNVNTIDDIYNALKAEYDKLNGYNVSLASIFTELKATTKIIKNFIGEDVFNNILELVNEPRITNNADYLSRFNQIYNKFIDAIKTAMTSTVLVQAQQNALGNIPLANINDISQADQLIISLSEKVQDINILILSMTSLKTAYTNASEFINQHLDAYNKLDTWDPKVKEFKESYAKAQIVFSPYSEKDANIQNISEPDCRETRSALTNNLTLVKILTIKTYIDEKLAQITNNSSTTLKNLKQKVTDEISDIAVKESTVNAFIKIDNNLGINLKLEPIYKAFDNANDIQDKISDLTTAINNANEFVASTLKSNAQPNEQEVKTLADKINTAILRDKLTKLDAKAKEVMEPTDELKEAITYADGTLKDSIEPQYQDAIDKLEKALLTEPLRKEIAKAKKENETLNDSDLTTAINNAEKVLTQPNLTENTIKTETQKLEDALQNAINKHNLKEEIDKLVTDTNLKLADWDKLLKTNHAFNSSTQIISNFKQALKVAKDIVNKVQSENKLDDTIKANLQAQIDTLTNLAAEIIQFSDEKFMQDNTQIPFATDFLNKLTNLSNDDKNKANKEFNNALTYKEAMDALKTASDLNNQIAAQINQIKNNINIVINKLPVVDQNDINSIINDTNSLKDKVPAKDLEDINNAISGLSDFSQILNALNNYENSNVKDSDYSNKLNNLTNLISEFKPVVAKDPSIEVNALNSKAQNLVNTANNLIKLIESLQKNNETEFNNAIDQLAKENDIYSSFKQVIANNKYFEILSSSQYSKDQVANLKNILNSTALKQMFPVVQSTILTEIKETASGFPWWAYVVIASSIIWFAALAIFIKTKK
ncbi:coiled-coil domain-containing protein [Mycoplasma sp. VS30B]